MSYRSGFNRFGVWRKLKRKQVPSYGLDGLLILNHHNFSEVRGMFCTHLAIGIVLPASLITFEKFLQQMHLAEVMFDLFRFDGIL
jgi:hypothetical protein